MAHPRMCWLFITLLIMLMPVSPGPKAQPAIFSGKDDVKKIISDFRGEMSVLIAQAGGESRVTLLRVFQLSDSLINSLTAAYGDAVKLTFKELDQQQQKAFNDTHNLLAEMKEAVSEPAKQGAQLGDKWAAVISDVLSFSKKPIVTYYGPGYIPPSSLMGSVTITITGVRLHSLDLQRPVLVVGGSDFSSDEITDVSLSFVVPRSSFPSPATGTMFARATLKVFREPEGWLNRKRQDEVLFPLLFIVLPESLGSYSVSSTIRKEVRELKPFVSPDVSVTRNGGGGSSAERCYVPEPGYKFDTNTARPTETVHTAYKDNDHSPGTNNGRVDFAEKVNTPDRICIFIIANTICTECGATTAGHLEVMMSRTVYESEVTESPMRPLTWNTDTKLPLLENATSQIITFKLFDEITRMGSLTSVMSLPFLQVVPDARNATVFLRPERNWSAR